MDDGSENEIIFVSEFWCLCHFSGFPDFPAPPEIKEAAIAAINADFNQYRWVVIWEIRV